jgi:HEAT repeat protein
MRRYKRAVSFALVLSVVLPACRKEPPKPPDVAEFVAKLRDPNPEVRGPAVLELIRRGDEAALPVAALLEDPDSRIRGVAASTLWSMGPRSKAALPQIVRALADESAEVRLGAAMACEAVGPDAASAVPALTRLLRDPDGTVRRQAAKSLGAIGSAAASAIPALGQASKEAYMHDAAEDAIRRIRTTP